MIAENVAGLPISAVSGILSRAAAAGWSDTIHMAGGEPRFPPPPGALEALKQASVDDLTKYSGFLGRDDLLAAIRHKLSTANGIDTGKVDVICTPGGSSALYLALLSVIEPGCEVLVQDPCWEHYLSIVRLLGAKPVRFKMARDGNRLALDPQEIRRAITPRTRAILVNTPLNPSGDVLTRRECEDLVEVAKAARLPLIVDEEYEAFIYGGRKHISPASLDPSVITLHSFSKSFALTGIRLGYISGPPAVIEAARRASLYSHMYPPSPSQVMALGALSGDWRGYIKTVSDLYQAKVARFRSALKGLPGVQVPEPEGGLYLFPRFEGPQADEMANILVDKHHLLCVPGHVAGENGARHIRFFIGVPDEAIDEAAARIGRAVRAGAELERTA
jgi:aspartate aminotransferase